MHHRFGKMVIAGTLIAVMFLFAGGCGTPPIVDEGYPPPDTGGIETPPEIPSRPSITVGKKPLKTIYEPKISAEKLAEKIEEERLRREAEIEDNSKEPSERMKKAFDLDSDRDPEEISPDRRRIKPIIVKAPGEVRKVDLAPHRDPDAEESEAPPKPDKLHNMVKVSAAKIDMGKNLSRSHSAEDYDTPEHTIEVKEFWIDKYEVSNAEYRKFVDATGHKSPSHWTHDDGSGKISGIPPGKENHPVVNVSWNDSKAYAEWADKRLPTEAEWELAARGTSPRRFPWGDKFDPTRCNVRDSHKGDNAGTVTVDSYPNGLSPYFVYNMCGNVMEWTADWYERYSGNKCTTTEKYYGNTHRVLRGGCFFFGHKKAMTYARFHDDPANWYTSYYGFRCATDAE